MATSSTPAFGANRTLFDANGKPDSSAVSVPPRVHFGPAADGPVEFKVTGQIGRMIFEKPEDGFYIFTLQPTGTKGAWDQQKVKGYGHNLIAGQEVSCVGTWETGKNPRYPDERTLSATAINDVIPTSVAGIRKMLNNGFVKGIGPKYTELLLSHFGAIVLDVAEHAPHRILSIPGLGEARAKAFISAVSEKKAVPRIMSFLAEIGLGPGLSHRVFKELGVDAVKKIKANPYALTAVPLIAFATADKVARQMGVAPDSSTRLEAGLQAMLTRESQNGSTAVPVEAAVEKAAKLLSYSSDNGGLGEVVSVHHDKIRVVLSRAITEKKILELRVFKDGTEVLSLPEFAQQEAMIARNLARLVSARSRAMRQVDMASPHFAHLDESQRAACQMALTSNVSVITGGPGCGKTTVTKSIIQAVRDARLAHLACGPTGRAAKRFMEATGFEASTMHRALESRGSTFGRDQANPLFADFIVADEQSMSDTWISHSLLKAVASGSQLLYVGDVDQLQSIGAGAVLKNLIDSGCIPVTRLNQVHRQAAGSDIITNAHAINSGKVPVSKAGGSDFSMVSAAGSNQVGAVIAQYNKLLKEGFKPEDIQILTPRRHNSDLGANALNKQLKAFINPGTPGNSIKRGKFDDEMTFSTGDRVMQVANNKDLGIYNGDIGYITSVNKLAKEICIDFSGEHVSISPDDLGDLDLAYATTIHKSQGSEFPAVIIPVSSSHWMMWDRSLLYTAVTRGKADVSLVGDLYMLKKIVEKESTNLRVTGLVDEIDNAFKKYGLSSALSERAKKPLPSF